MHKKQITLAELKAGYIDRHGFVMITNAEYTIESMERMLSSLIPDAASCMPEFYVTIGNGIFFVYPEKCSFASGFFYQRAQSFNQFVGNLAEVDILGFFLQNYGTQK